MRWGSIKRFVSLACAGGYHRADWMTSSKTKHRESTLWQRRFWEHQIRDDVDFARHVDSLHYNPVKHGLVAQVADLPKGHKGSHSSFHRHIQQGIYPLNWAGIKNWEDSGSFSEP